MGQKRQEYFSKFLGDLAKAVFAVGLASHLFKDFPEPFRMACGIGFVGLIVISLWIHPKD